MIVWVVGAGGLLGSAVVRMARRRNDTILVSSQVPWSDPYATIARIRSDAASLKNLVKARNRSDKRWAIVWAAGHATTSSSQYATDRELEAFSGCLRAIGQELGSFPDGIFALASSAGGVYAGGSKPPFSSLSPVTPLAPYGWLKVHQEATSQQLLDSAIGVTILRIANLYGPGQDLDKLQGLITRLALTSVTKEPLKLFVPLDTMRDYITADDAAARVLHWVDANRSGLSTRVVASGQSTSLGYLINLMKDIARVQTPIAYGMHISAAHQSKDLRLIPDRDETINALPITSLPVGIKAVYDDVLWRVMYRSNHLVKGPY